MRQTSDQHHEPEGGREPEIAAPAEEAEQLATQQRRERRRERHGRGHVAHRARELRDRSGCRARWRGPAPRRRRRRRPGSGARRSGSRSSGSAPQQTLPMREHDEAGQQHRPTAQIVGERDLRPAGQRQRRTGRSKASTARYRRGRPGLLRWSAVTAGYMVSAICEDTVALISSQIGGLVVRMRGNSLVRERRNGALNSSLRAAPGRASVHQAVGRRPCTARRPSAMRCITTISPLPGKIWLTAVTTT